MAEAMNRKNSLVRERKESISNRWKKDQAFLLDKKTKGQKERQKDKKRRKMTKRTAWCASARRASVTGGRKTKLFF